MSRRVVVTGVGLVSPLGIGTSATWEALCGGRSGIGPITKFDPTGYAARIAGEVSGFDPLAFIARKDVKKMDVFIQYAIAAADFARTDAQLEVTPDLAPRVGVYIASGIGGFSTIEREHHALIKGGPRKISPFFIPAAIINLAAGQVSIRLGAKGPNSATCTACSASAHAVGDAFETILRGDADVMVAGGSEAGDHPHGRRRVRGDARALDPQRRADARLSPLRPRARRIHHRRGCRGHHSRRARPGPGARGAGLCGARRIRDVRGRPSRHRAGRGRGRRPARDAGGQSRRPASRRIRSATSTRTGRRRRSTIG